MQIKHNCEECESLFKLQYDEHKCESDPQYCPFCGSYLILDDTQSEDEEEY
jgi:rRNA maturation endonuclease Nob1